MPIQMIVAICIGVLAMAGAIFVISDVRAYNRRKDEFSERRNQGVSLSQELEIAYHRFPQKTTAYRQKI